MGGIARNTRTAFLGALLAVAFCAAGAPAEQVFSQDEIDYAVHGPHAGPSLVLVMTDGTTRTLAPTADAYTWGSIHADENRGDYTLLTVQYNASSPYYQKFSFLQFDLSDVTGTLSSAKLEIYCSYANQTGTLENTICEIIDDSWSEYGVTYNNQPALGTELETFAPVNKAWHELTVTSAANSALQGDGILSLGIKANIPNGTNYYSRERDLTDFRLTSWPVRFNGRAMFSLAIMAFLDDDTESSYHVKAVDRLLAHIRNFLTTSGGPDCNGRLENLKQSVVPLTLAIARHTSAVWNGLTATEQSKCDLLMKAYAIMAHYQYCDGNNWIGPMNFDGPQKKTYNPNHVEGNVDGLIAARLYFDDYHTSGGAWYLNEEVFKPFDYHDFVDDLYDAGFLNIVNCWHTTTASVANYDTCTYHTNGVCCAAQKLLMEGDGQGSTLTDPNGGTGIGVRQEFVYSGDTTHTGTDAIPLQDAYGVWKKLALRMYYWDCTNAEFDSIAYIRDPDSPTPMQGRTGMCYEFRSGDADGVRSCPNYVYLGWDNNMMSRAMLELLGYWPGTGETDRICDLMNTGTIDFFHKVETGYHAYKLGAAKDFDIDDFIPQGYLYMKALWTRLLAPESPASDLEIAHVVTEADAFVYGGAPTSNYGTSTDILLKGSPNIAYHRIGYARFGIDVGLSVVSRAVLILDTDTSGTIFTGGNAEIAYVPDQTWGERTINYNNRPATSTEFDPVTFYAEPEQHYEIDVTSIVSPLLDAGETTVTFELSTQGDYLIRFMSREEKGIRPELVLYGYDTDYKTTGFVACDDAFVRGDQYSAINYGNATSLAVKGAPNVEFNRKSFLKFDFRDEFTKVLSARLNLKAVSGSDPTLVNALQMVEDVDWDESTITWDNQPEAGDDVTTWTPVSGSAVSLVLSDQVADALRGPAKMTVRIDTQQNIYAAYASSEYGTILSRPTLEIGGFYQPTVQTVFTAEADAYVRGGTYADINYGSSSGITVKGSSNPNYNRVGYIRFNIRDHYTHVTTATLSLMPTTAPGDPLITNTMRVCGDDWEEDAITFNTQPTSGPTVATWSPAAYSEVLVDVTAAVQDAAMGDGRLSIRIDGNSDDVVNYGSRDGSINNMPMLEIYGY